jgi:hypothetical protein
LDLGYIVDAVAKAKAEPIPERNPIGYNDIDDDENDY